MPVTNSPWVSEGDSWYSLRGPDGTDGLHLRLRARDGRLVITDLYLHGGEIDAGALRGVPIARLEAAINASDSRVAEVAAFAPFGDDEPTLAVLRGRVPGVPRRSAVASGTKTIKSSRRRRLTRPTGVDPDDFYRRVAEAYRGYAIDTKAPAAAIAGEADVPVTTAHRWVREARRRGHLAPVGRRGKAG